jgi:hypothetical protein
MGHRIKILKRISELSTVDEVTGVGTETEMPEPVPKEDYMVALDQFKADPGQNKTAARIV